MAVDPSQVSAVIPTRGDVDIAKPLEPILAAGITDIVIWDNSNRSMGSDVKVYGRYAAITDAARPFIYTQDDDAVCPVAEILEAYDGDGLLVNVPPGEKPWVAWGAIFPRELPSDAFRCYLEAEGFEEGEVLPDEFLRWADVVFAHLVGWTTIDLGHEDLPVAFAPNRMYRQPDHYTGQAHVRAKAEALKGALA